jgi:hypothetical protein
MVDKKLEKAVEIATDTKEKKQLFEEADAFYHTLSTSTVDERKQLLDLATRIMYRRKDETIKQVEDDDEEEISAAAMKKLSNTVKQGKMASVQIKFRDSTKPHKEIKLTHSTNTSGGVLEDDYEPLYTELYAKLKRHETPADPYYLTPAAIGYEISFNKRMKNFVDA